MYSIDFSSLSSGDGTVGWTADDFDVKAVSDVGSGGGGVSLIISGGERQWRKRARTVRGDYVTIMT
jgi:hypothetical protein